MKKSLIILVIIGLCIGSIFILTKDKKVKEDIKTKDKVQLLSAIFLSWIDFHLF